MCQRSCDLWKLWQLTRLTLWLTWTYLITILFPFLPFLKYASPFKWDHCYASLSSHASLMCCCPYFVPHWSTAIGSIWRRGAHFCFALTFDLIMVLCQPEGLLYISGHSLGMHVYVAMPEEIVFYILYTVCMF